MRTLFDDEHAAPAMTAAALETKIHDLEREICLETGHRFEGRNWVVQVGDVLDRLRALPNESVHCVVTSPPYFGLRDYGVDGQIGLENTPEDFTAKMVDVFREVRRVLRKDGTCWVNLGDAYVGGGRGSDAGSTLQGSVEHQAQSRTAKMTQSQRRDGHQVPRSDYRVAGLQMKNLMGMPWRVAFALQADGWCLRQDIIWHKRSPMPESCTDRCTKSHEYIFKFSKGDEYFHAGLIQDHEYVFLLAKQQRYFYDAEAIREAGSRADWSVQKFKGGDLTTHHKSSVGKEEVDPEAGRNCRSVWTFSAEPTKLKHFAAFPSVLPARCIKAGTSEKGCCAACGSPWRRVLCNPPHGSYTDHSADLTEGMSQHAPNKLNGRELHKRPQPETTGWQPSCSCGVSAEVVPCTVLDPFSGSGTTGLVATELGRCYIGIELNQEYAAMSARRIESWKFRDAARQPAPAAGQQELF